MARLKGHTGYVFSLAFSPDGATLVSGSGDSTVRLWDTAPLKGRYQALRDAEGDLLGLVDDSHAIAADLAQDAKVAQLLQRRSFGRGFIGLAAVVLGLFDLDHGREQVAEVAGQVGITVEVLLQGGTLAGPQADRKLLGQLIEQGVLPGFRGGHRESPKPWYLERGCRATPPPMRGRGFLAGLAPRAVPATRCNEWQVTGSEPS
jgi:hypothetical protein